MVPKLGLSAGPAGLSLVLVVAALVLVAGCEPDVKHRKLVKWDQAYVISVVPERTAGFVDGKPTYEPMCRSTTEDPDGLGFAVLFQGSIKKGEDRDQSLKPGDYLDNTEIVEDKVTSDRFEFSLDCLEPYPDDNLYECSDEEAIKGSVLEEFSVDFHRYDQEEADNASNLAVVIMIDMSGSMVGWVDRGGREDHWEGFSGITGIFFENATDLASVRFAAVESLISTLNDDDLLIVVAFKENSIKVICKSPTGLTDAKELWEECFGTKREFVIGPTDDTNPDSQSVLDSFTGDEEGRTPLWSALNWVYDKMREPGDKSQDADLRHILVITDGPDTCGESTDLNQCSGKCLMTSDSHASFLAKLDQDPDQVIPVHFVQMQAKGYPERDPRQMEVACLTGGHYAFINTSDITPESLLEVMHQTLRRIRFTFRGYWRFHLAVGEVKKTNPPDVGWVYGVEVSGKAMPREDRMLVKQEDSFGSSPGTAFGHSNVDRRVSFRKECDPANDHCPAPEEAGPCSTRIWWCDEQTLTCKSTLKWGEDGTETGCGTQTVTIQLTIRYSGGSPDDQGQVELGGVPTRCCAGRCQPPMLPMLPDDIKQPGDMPQACAYYTSDWRYSEESGWSATMTIKAMDGCEPVDKVKAALQYDDVDDLYFPGDWDCGGDNCYPPPGADSGAGL